ncbi:MAG: helix-turn-helix domain-containing protein, partial [Loigolactobacillus coryniformis]|nr:helix-turn-helix domain-containing protein [Loigolactobacillus coryniformis]
MGLKQQLKSYRLQKGWTQKMLAEKLNVSDKTISSWETGRS